MGLEVGGMCCLTLFHANCLINNPHRPYLVCPNTSCNSEKTGSFFKLLLAKDNDGKLTTELFHGTLAEIQTYTKSIRDELQSLESQDRDNRISSLGDEIKYWDLLTFKNMRYCTFCERNPSLRPQDDTKRITVTGLVVADAYLSSIERAWKQTNSNVLTVA